jgi:hypothetical protein
MSEIGADDAGLACASERKSEVTCSAAEIQDESAGTIENGAETLCGACAPETVELQREKMIEQIVARGDTGEHLADFFGGVCFGDSAFRTSSLHGCGGFSHGVFQRDCCWQR